MRKSISAIAAVVVLSTGFASAQSATETEQATSTPPAAVEQTDCGFLPCALANIRLGNPFDSKTWWDGSEGHEHENVAMDITPTDPEFLMKIPNPESHSMIHMAMTNPENWGQFMKPDTMSRMLSPELVGKWFDPETFSVLADPQTYAYWMQPGAFMHVVSVENYAQLVNPEAYANLFMDVASSWIDAGKS